MVRGKRPTPLSKSLKCYTVRNLLLSQLRNFKGLILSPHKYPITCTSSFELGTNTLPTEDRCIEKGETDVSAFPFRFLLFLISVVAETGSTLRLTKPEEDSTDDRIGKIGVSPPIRNASFQDHISSILGYAGPPPIESLEPMQRYHCWSLLGFGFSSSIAIDFLRDFFLRPCGHSDFGSKTA